eukprot:5300243-Amphidinium_carterae.1
MRRLRQKSEADLAEAKFSTESTTSNDRVLGLLCRLFLATFFTSHQRWHPGTVVQHDSLVLILVIGDGVMSDLPIVTSDLSIVPYDLPQMMMSDLLVVHDLPELVAYDLPCFEVGLAKVQICYKSMGFDAR